MEWQCGYADAWTPTTCKWVEAGGWTIADSPVVGLILLVVFVVLGLWALAFGFALLAGGNKEG